MCENMCTLNLFDGRLEANEDWGTCSCVCVTCACGWPCIPKLCSVFLFLFYFFHPTRQYDLISADMFFSQETFYFTPSTSP